MSCYHPLFAVDFGIDSTTGKHIIKMIPDRVDYNMSNLLDKYGDSLLFLPCGKCLGCAEDYAKSWADRIVLESSLYEKNCFITLTYEDRFLPKLPVKDHLRDFVRRVRDKHPDITIRFFGVGELGSTTKRSHYHIILFNFDFEDKKPFSKSGDNQLFRSEELESLWPYGISSIGAVTPSSAAYTARYSMKKKITGEHEGEFIIMSTHPGIGKGYFDLHKDSIFESDVIYCDSSPGKKLVIPRYFRRLAEKEEVPLSRYSRFKDKIQSTIKINSRRSLRSVKYDEESFIIDELCANRVQRSRNKI